MKYFFQSMGYNPVERIKDLQDCSTKWKKELKWQLMMASGMKIRRFAESQTVVARENSNCT